MAPVPELQFPPRRPALVCPSRIAYPRAPRSGGTGPGVDCTHPRSARPAAEEGRASRSPEPPRCLRSRRRSCSRCSPTWRIRDASMHPTRRESAHGTEESALVRARTCRIRGMAPRLHLGFPPPRTRARRPPAAPAPRSILAQRVSRHARWVRSPCANVHVCCPLPLALPSSFRPWLVRPSDGKIGSASFRTLSEA